MRYLGLTLLFCFFINSGFSQVTVKEGILPVNVSQNNDSTTVINGTAPGAVGKMLVLTAPSDLITFWENQLASAKVGPDGKFSISVKSDRTKVAVLAINFHKAEIFLEPGKTYRVIIDSINYDDVQEINPFIQSQSLKLQILFEDPHDLNYVIGDFNGLYNAFLLENFNALYRDRNKTKVDTFRVQMDARFGVVTNPYFKAYLKYKFAALEQLTKYYNTAELARRYFTDKPVLYLNLEYMDFFNSYFTKYLNVSSKILHLTDYKIILKGANPYAALMKTLAADSLLANEQLRELVLLKGMMEFYSNPDYKQEEVLSVIRAVSSGSVYPDNKVVAENMVRLLTKLKPGTRAPEFTLPDRNKKQVSLKDIEGKAVVLSFWTTYCQGCLSEMDLIKPMYDKYKDKVAFVSISADADFNKMNYFISMKKDFVWTFLHIGDQSGVLSDYEVRSYPLFVLIDKTGKIYKYPAEQPGNGLEAAIEKMIQE